MTLLATLTACGGTEETASNIAAEEVNAATDIVAPPPVEPAANADVEQPADEPQPTPTSSAPAAPTRPALEPAKPAPAKPKAPEPAPDPHAGHDMNNMQH